MTRYCTSTSSQPRKREPAGGLALSFTSDVTDSRSRNEPRPRLRPVFFAGFNVTSSMPDGVGLYLGRGGRPFKPPISSRDAVFSALSAAFYSVSRLTDTCRTATWST